MGWLKRLFCKHKCKHLIKDLTYPDADRAVCKCGITFSRDDMDYSGAYYFDRLNPHRKERW